MSVTFRFGQPDDIPAIRDFIMDAGAGLFEYLFDGILPGVSARHLIKLAVADPSANLAYQNALLAVDEDGNRAGMALCYPASAYGIPSVVENTVPNRRLDPLREMLTQRVEGTFYLNTLAVAPWARGRALGGTLTDLCLEWAAEEGYDGLSLHVWADNTAAVHLYTDRGFEVVQRFTPPQSRSFLYAGPILLLQRVCVPE